MAILSTEQASKRERTLLIAVLLSAPGPLIIGMTALSSQSSTQLADFIRRSAELVALFVSWWVFHYLQRQHENSEQSHVSLEKIAEFSVAGAMGCSGIIMLLIALSRFSNAEIAGNVISGLVIASLGLLTNSWFWRRYSALTQEQFNPITAAQKKLYRAKSWVDLCVVIALATVTLAPHHPATHYVDIIGSIGVALYLLYSGLDTLRASNPRISSR